MANRISSLNLKANKKLKDIYEAKDIKKCETTLQGCWHVTGLSWHHRKPRISYHKKGDTDQEIIDNLSCFNETLLVCPVCHDKLTRDKVLSNDFFTRLREPLDLHTEL